MSAEEETELARYVLAYLIQHNYSQTASIFQQECQHLSARNNSLMILPSVSLKDILLEYKTRQNTGVLVKSLGTDLAWKALWEKLQQTLDQINTLALGVTSSGASAKPTGVWLKDVWQQSMPRVVVSSSPTIPHPPQGQGGVSNIHLPQGDMSSAHSPQGEGGVSSRITPTEASYRSPRKNRSQPPKRKLVEPVIESAQPLTGHASETNDGLQHILNNLIINQEIHEKLANAINQCVSSHSSAPDGSVAEPGASQSLTPSFLSETAVENILEMATTEPWFEELASTVPLSTIDSTTPQLLAELPPTNGPTTSRPIPETTMPPDAKRCKSEQDMPTTAASLNLDFEKFLDKLHERN